MTDELKRCTRCVLPETAAGITFDENGVCSVCSQGKTRTKDYYQEARSELEALFAKYRGQGEYDCLVPYSGGKDSSYVLYICKQYGMKPLAYNFNNHFQTPIGKRNMETVVRALGVPLISFAPDWQVACKLCRKGLEMMGDFCWFCNSGATATSIRRAAVENISLVVFGEESALYDPRFGFGEAFETKFRQMAQEGIPESEFLDQDIVLQDMASYSLPPREFRENIKIIYLGKYIPWNKKDIVELLKSELDWREGEVEGASTTFEHIDCQYTGIRDYIKYLKRGFGRHTHLASLLVREGKMTREQALVEAAKDGAEPSNLNEFLARLGMERDEFFAIVRKHRKY